MKLMPVSCFSAVFALFMLSPVFAGMEPSLEAKPSVSVTPVSSEELKVETIVSTCDPHKTKSCDLKLVTPEPKVLSTTEVKIEPKAKPCIEPVKQESPKQS